MSLKEEKWRKIGEELFLREFETCNLVASSCVREGNLSFMRMYVYGAHTDGGRDAFKGYGKFKKKEKKTYYKLRFICERQ